MLGPEIAAREARLRASFPDAYGRQSKSANLAKYAAAIALAVLIGMLPILIQQLNGSGDIAWRPIIAAGLSALLAALTGTGIASQFTRLGSEQIGSQVSSLQGQGIPRSEMVVLSRETVRQLLAQGAGRPPGTP